MEADMVNGVLDLYLQAPAAGSIRVRAHTSLAILACAELAYAE